MSQDTLWQGGHLLRMNTNWLNGNSWAVLQSHCCSAVCLNFSRKSSLLRFLEAANIFVCEQNHHCGLGEGMASRTIIIWVIKNELLPSCISVENIFSSCHYTKQSRQSKPDVKEYLEGCYPWFQRPPALYLMTVMPSSEFTRIAISGRLPLLQSPDAPCPITNATSFFSPGWMNAAFLPTWISRISADILRGMFGTSLLRKLIEAHTTISMLSHSILSSREIHESGRQSHHTMSLDADCWKGLHRHNITYKKINLIVLSRDTRLINVWPKHQSWILLNVFIWRVNTASEDRAPSCLYHTYTDKVDSNMNWITSLVIHVFSLYSMELNSNLMYIAMREVER